MNVSGRKRTAWLCAAACHSRSLAPAVTWLLEVFELPLIVTKLREKGQGQEHISIENAEPVESSHLTTRFVSLYYTKLQLKL